MKEVISQLTKKDSGEIDVQKLLAALLNDGIEYEELYKSIKDTSK